MALHELTAVELDAVCGGGRNGKPRLDIDITVIKIKQVQRNKTNVIGSRDVDASNNQVVTIGGIG